ncbi:MAG TPA: hypothetical protein PKM88_02370 [bacterium]|nr:hypothetical protein [bacterium]
MAEEKKGIFGWLFGGSKKGCCDLRIEEVKESEPAVTGTTPGKPEAPACGCSCGCGDKTKP